MNTIPLLCKSNGETCFSYKYFVFFCFIHINIQPYRYYDTAAYLVLHVLIVLSQYLSMEIMKSPQVREYKHKFYIFYNLYYIYMSFYLISCFGNADWWSNSEKHTSYLQVPSAHDWLFFSICPIGIVNLLVSFYKCRLFLYYKFIIKLSWRVINYYVYKQCVEYSSTSMVKKIGRCKACCGWECRWNNKCLACKKILFSTIRVLWC